MKHKIHINGNEIELEQLPNGKFKKPDLAQKYNGYKYSIAPLKQTVEEIMCFQKPYLTGSCLHDTLAYEAGDESITVGALDIDGCRVGTDGGGNNGRKVDSDIYGKYGPTERSTEPQGRYPSQTFCDSAVAERLDAQSGVSKTPSAYTVGKQADGNIQFNQKEVGFQKVGYGDTAGASKILHKCDYDNDDHDLFIYAPKVSGSANDEKLTITGERHVGCENLYWLDGKRIDYETWNKLRLENIENKGNKEWKRHPIAWGNNHATLKPQRLLTHILKLFKTPNPQVCFDPFMGSGSTGMACKTVGYDFIGVEMNEEYFEIAKRRINNT